ncbi:MAG: hypothetical protein WC612_00800 [Bdellovibrionales bacterium]|jgi:uncharacterized protein YfaS (alpha-2-macroglobulin family)
MKIFVLKCVTSAVFVFLLSGSFAQAEPLITKKGATSVPFKVKGYSVHVEAPKAEVCLSFTQPFDETDRTKIVADLSIKKKGKLKKIEPEDLSLTSQDLCVQGLDHRSSYHLVLRGLESKTGEPMASSYTLSFVVPDRKASLSFVEDGTLFVLPRHMKTGESPNEDKAQGGKVDGMAHVLRSVNILATHLTLYRFEDRNTFAGAWQQFKQSPLSPSESQTFAREKGKVVFESDLVFGDRPNEAQTLIAPLPSDEALKAGLYYLAATPRGKEGVAPALFAGQWFLVSDLHVLSTVEKEGVQAIVSSGEGAQHSSTGATVALWSRDGKLVAEAKTKDDGSVFLPVKAEGKATGLLLSAQSDAGALDMAEIAPSRVLSEEAQGPKATLLLDRDRYTFSKTAMALLRPRMPMEQGKEGEETVLKVLGPDYRVYSEQTVSPFEKESVHVVPVTLPVNGKAGLWFLSWQKKDGQVLAQKTFALSLSDQEAHVSVSLSRAGADLSLPLNLSIRTNDEKGNALPYQEGVLDVYPARPSLEGWEAYRFGVTATAQEDKNIHKIPFMTDGKGEARLSLDTGVLDPALDALSFKASLKEGAESAPVTVPLWRTSPLIGLRALPDERPFAQNGLAQFDVIAVDPSRKRVEKNDLYYVVYEEGRNFEWFPSEGNWDYKLLPQHRRVGGDALALAASGENKVSWPVATGRYLLEITNARGDVLARRSFEAGARSGQAADAAFAKKANAKTIEEPSATQTLGVKIGAGASLTVGVPTGVTAQISAMAKQKQTMARAVLLSDQSGKTIITEPVLVDGEGKATFHVSAQEKGAVTLAVMAWNDDQWGWAKATTEAALPLQVSGNPPDVLWQGDRAPFSLMIENNADEKALYSYEIKTPPKVTLIGATKGKLDFRKNKKQTLRLTLLAQGEADGLVQFKLIHANGKMQEQEWPLRVVQGGVSLLTSTPFSVEPDKIFSSEKGEQALLTPLPVSESLIEALAVFAQDEPQTTTEIALWLEAARLWSQPLVDLGLFSWPSLNGLMVKREDELLHRQNGDGGFAPTRMGEPSDLAGTAYALKTLPARYEKSGSFAAEWLESKVKNTWFDENEREAHALAFEALAQKKRIDISALRYFAETSQDKTLNSATAAALALALRLGGDEAEAQRWAERGRSTLESEPEKESSSAGAVLRLLALDEKNDFDSLKKTVASLKPFAVQVSFEQRASFLTGFALTALRAGSWRLQVKGTDEKYYGVHAFSFTPEDKKGLTLKNVSLRPLYGLALSSQDKKKKMKLDTVGTIKRSVYQLNGEIMEEGMPLKVGEVYGLVLQGSDKKEGASPMRLTWPLDSAFAAMVPLSGDPAVMKGLAAPWLEGDFAPLSSVIIAATGVSFTLDPTGNWQTMIMIKPLRAGYYILPWMRARGEQGVFSYSQNALGFRVE